MGVDIAPHPWIPALLVSTLIVASVAYGLSARSLANQEVDDATTFHLRIHRGGELLASTWPNETGVLDENTDSAPILAGRDSIPRVLAPLAELVTAARSAPVLRAEGVLLPEIAPTAWAMPPPIRLAREGTWTATEARATFGENLSPGTWRFASLIPMTLQEASDGSWRYQITLDAPAEAEVERTDGLYVRTALTDDGWIELRLTAPFGGFTSLGCAPVPGTLIPPGHYAATNRADAFEVYADRVEYELRGSRVDIELTLIENVKEN